MENLIKNIKNLKETSKDFDSVINEMRMRVCQRKIPNVSLEMLEEAIQIVMEEKIDNSIPTDVLMLFLESEEAIRKYDKQVSLNESFNFVSESDIYKKMTDNKEEEFGNFVLKEFLEDYNDTI